MAKLKMFYYSNKVQTKLMISVLLTTFYFSLYSSPTYITTEMIRALNPENFNRDFSSYHQKTSLFCAHMSDAAYLSKTEVTMLQYMLNIEYGKNTFQFVDVETSVRSRALLAITDKFLIISFRGTEFNKIDDILTDVKFKNYANSDSASSQLHNLPTGHAGFRKGLIALMNEKHFFNLIDSLINSNSKKSTEFPIFLTGHSMGAAYSSMFSLCLISESKYIFKGAYNFAPPLAIYCPTAMKVRNSNYHNLIYDIVNYKDYIARAGGNYCQNKYRHIGKFYRISTTSTLYREDEHYIEFTFSEGKPLVKYHNLMGYINALGLAVNHEDNVTDRETKGECIFCNNIYRAIVCNPLE